MLRLSWLRACLNLLVKILPQLVISLLIAFLKKKKKNSQGNAQGKKQRHLGVEGNKDFLQAPLWSGNPVQITVPPAEGGKIHLSLSACFS